MTGREALIYLAIKYEGDWEKVIEAVRKREPLNEAEGQEALKGLASHALCISDPSYPECWKQAVRPPLVVFYYGNLELLADEKKCVSYIGSREASEYGVMMAKKLAGGLAKEGLTIVTGLAMGIDAVATESALEAGGSAIGILGNGIDICYPSTSQPLYERLKRRGLILSEYPGKTPPKKDSFPARNRIVAATSHTIIVGEAAKRSGTLITVGFALGLNKEIGCVPYPADAESSCNLLIKDGAALIESVEDANVLAGYVPEKTAP
jgi:DNA processing protein